MISLGLLVFSYTCRDLKSTYKTDCCPQLNSQIPSSCDELKTTFDTECCGNDLNKLLTGITNDTLYPSVCSVNHVTSRTKYAEPWKITRLSATRMCEASEGTFCWSIAYIPNDEYVDEYPNRMKEDDKYREFCSESLIDHEFSYPGDYHVCVSHASNTECRTIQNRFVHRHVGDLTQDEFDDYANAFNHVRSLSTDEGRSKYGSQCLYNDTDFYTHDVFVSLHHNAALVRNHDRLHYLTMQEPAHMAWTTLAQKAIRCICPSCSHPYYDPVKDYTRHSDDGTIESLLNNSPIFKDDMMGGANNYYKDVTDPAYVTDGKLGKDWSITQTKSTTYWCDPLLELSGMLLYETCVEKFTLHNGYYSVGISGLQPKPVSHMQKVSRKPYFFLGSNQYCKNRILSLANNMVDVENTESLQNMWGIVSTAVHSFGHDCIGGKWNVTDAYTTEWLDKYAPNHETVIDALDDGFKSTIVSTGNDKSVILTLYYLQSGEHPSIVCHDEYCTCKRDSNDKVIDLNVGTRWYYDDINDRSKTQATYRRSEQSSWPDLKLNDCNWPRSGTFDWSPHANQDPFFYLWHWYTFYVTDIGYRHLMERHSQTIVELADTEPSLKNTLERERDGNRLFDTSVFKNLIPYKKGQKVGGYHTWADIIDHQTSYKEFVFE